MMLRFFYGDRQLSTAKTIFWKRSGLLMSLRFGDCEGRSEITLKDPPEVYAGRRQPFASSCRRYFPIAAFRTFAAPAARATGGRQSGYRALGQTDIRPKRSNVSAGQYLTSAASERRLTWPDVSRLRAGSGLKIPIRLAAEALDESRHSCGSPPAHIKHRSGKGVAP